MAIGRQWGGSFVKQSLLWSSTIPDTLLHWKTARDLHGDLHRGSAVTGQTEISVMKSSKWRANIHPLIKDQYPCCSWDNSYVGWTLIRKLSVSITLSPTGRTGLLPAMTDCQPPCTADSDFSLMADWACHQSHYNLQFDMLQAELFDSRDSYCHPQSKQ